MGNMDPKALRTRVENISNIPTIPSVLKQLSTIIENPKISLNEISHFVSKDPALTTKILQMVNSALYGFPGRISSVNHAVMLLGLNVVKGLLLSVSVFEIMHKAMIGLREHSIGVASSTRRITTRRSKRPRRRGFPSSMPSATTSPRPMPPWRGGCRKNGTSPKSSAIALQTTTVPRSRRWRPSRRRSSTWPISS
jgi:hypothetical protein